ncbi:Fimbrial protein [Enterobacteriaceae bacterium bta3-1]|nr:Fimbrial protein [Enterobacteriaceae bacterium bta3-1]
MADFTGQTAGRVNFNIVLSGCVLTGDTQVGAYFEPDAAKIDPATGHLINTATDADKTGVSLQLLDGSSGSVIKAGDSSQLTSNTYATPDGDGAATLPYLVEYYKIGSAVAAGVVTSKVTYSLIYK